MRREVDTLDRQLIEREIDMLAEEVTDHQVHTRWAGVLQRSADPPLR